MCLVWLHGLVEDSAVVVVGRFSLLSWFALLSFQSIFSDDSLIRFGLFEMLEALSQLEEFDFVIFALLLEAIFGDQTLKSGRTFFTYL